jgi:hypothetical protein
MKVKNARQLFPVIALGILILAFQSTGSAQSAVMRATIPFDFYVVNTLMPAGEYTVSPLAQGSVLSLNDENGHVTSAVTIRVTNQHPDSSRLIFNRYGNTYFLSELDWAGYSAGHSFLKSKLELEAGIKNAPTSESVALK